MTQTTAEGEDARSRGPLPTDAELKVLQELWAADELTVAALHERVQDSWAVGYTTVLKLLQRLNEKGLVSRRSQGRAHLYRSAFPQEEVERRLARGFVARAFSGSLGRLLQRALPEGEARQSEIEQIRRALDRLDD